MDVDKMTFVKVCAGHASDTQIMPATHHSQFTGRKRRLETVGSSQGI